MGTVDSKGILTKHLIDSNFFLWELHRYNHNKTVALVCVCVCVCVCVRVHVVHTCNSSLLKGSIKLINSLHISLRSFPPTFPALFLFGCNSPSLNSRSSSLCSVR